eukprot:359619-Chlamydomonas_euryale.AAC.3
MGYHWICCMPAPRIAQTGCLAGCGPAGTTLGVPKKLRISSNPGNRVAHQIGLHHISRSRHGERKTMSRVQPVGASLVPIDQSY